jgi:peroxiredoxin
MTRVLRSLACAVGLAGAIQVGDKLPDVSFDLGFPPEKVPMSKLCQTYKKFAIVGLPGAFTPT